MCARDRGDLWHNLNGSKEPDAEKKKRTRLHSEEIINNHALLSLGNLTSFLLMYDTVALSRRTKRILYFIASPSNFHTLFN